MTKTFAERCHIAQQFLPDAQYRAMLTALHTEMLAKLAEQPAQPASEADMQVYKAIADNYHASLQPAPVRQKVGIIGHIGNGPAAMEAAFASALAAAPQAQPAPVQPGREHYEDGDVFERIAASKKQPAQRTYDTKRLDALAKNSWELRCFDMPTCEDDAAIGWRVVERRMAKPHERTVAAVFRDDPRQAIDAAIEANNGETP